MFVCRNISMENGTTLTNTFKITTNITSTFANPVEQGSVDVGVIIGSVLAVVFVLCIALALVYWNRRREYSKVPGMLSKE
jgi:ABC-type phosphate transport system permease subunit